MIFAQEIISDNGISVVAAAFFTALLGAVSAIGVALVNAKHKVEELKGVTVQAAESASQAQANTQNVSNGFVSRMDRKLDTIATNQDDINEKVDRLSESIQRHLEWHLDKET